MNNHTMEGTCRRCYQGERNKKKQQSKDKKKLKKNQQAEIEN